MSEIHVDEGNLSLSDSDDNSIWVTQSSFDNVNTQDVEDAVSYFDNIVELPGHGGKVVNCENLNKHEVEIKEWAEGESVQLRDFSSDIDNGYDVSTQPPYVMTRKFDRKKFIVGEGSVQDNLSFSQRFSDAVRKYEEANPLPPMYDESTIGEDMKRFGHVVSDDTLHDIKFKW